MMSRRFLTLAVRPPDLKRFLTAIDPLSFAEAASLMALEVFTLSAVPGHFRVLAAQSGQRAVNLVSLPPDLNTVMLIVTQTRIGQGHHLQAQLI